MDNKKNIIAVKIKTARRSNTGIGGIRMAALNKYHNGFIFLITLVFLFIIANLAFAETKVFVEEYTYQASEYDSKASCRVLALEQVKRLLLEKLGTYLESETEVKNFQLTKDQIVILTAGIVSAEIIDEKWDGKTYYLKAKISADPKDVANSIDKLRHDRQKTKELEETRKKAEAALREVERLKKELEIAKAKKPNLGPYNEAVKGLSATDWFDKGYALGIAGRNQEAMEAFSRAIELSPKDAEAYSNRGAVYGKLGDHKQAIRDHDRAIELNPKLAAAYNNRGSAYADLGNHRRAIKDFDRAIELNTKYEWAYANRGIAYHNLGDHKQAIRDYDRAIELDPGFAKAYNNRGAAYLILGNHQQAIRDYDRAIELDPKLEIAYINRGIAYAKLGDYRKAMRDLDKAIELFPKFAEAYRYRGIAYGALGDNQQALEDLKIAAGLGDKEAQNLLRSEGVSW
jgi:tetratricopeptide (TPR) repeat protein